MYSRSAASPVLRRDSNFAGKHAVALAVVFVLSFVLLFLGMTRVPNIYDESIVLTGAMRVAAGQIPHHDFYANYGPAQFYLDAGLFQVFGESVLVERLFDLLIKSVLLTLSYALVLSFSRKAVAAVTTGVLLLWLFGTNMISATAVVPVSLLNLVAAMLLLAVFARKPSGWRTFALGVVSGLAALFRYDTGGALLAIDACVLAIAAYTAQDTASSRFRVFASALWPCVAGFTLVFLPVAGLYLLRAPFADFRYDIITYPSHYYHRSRNLPFPRVGFRRLDDLACYLPIPIVLAALYSLLSSARQLKVRVPEPADKSRESLRRGFMIVFSILALSMYLKGWVRIGPVQLYLCTIPSLLLLAVLFESRKKFPKPFRLSVEALALLSIVAAIWSAMREAKDLVEVKSSVPAFLVRKVLHTVPPEESAWCSRPGPLTNGFCFNPGVDRIRATDYILSHTKPDQTLFEGLSRNDRVLANDNIVYFAGQRLPATKWSQFDPGIQNSAVIQTEMVQELERSRPPLIVLDSQFENTKEPNDSSRSTGVTLLDDYIHARYSEVETFGALAIWQRIAK
jgi:hypothetical protein